MVILLGSRLKAIIGIFMIFIGGLLVLLGSYLITSSTNEAEHSFPPVPYLNYINSKYNVIPIHINWLDSMQVDRVPDTSFYRVHQTIRLYLFFNTYIHGDESIVHIFHSDFSDAFSTSMKQGFDNIPRISNERIFNYPFELPGSSCKNQTANNQNNSESCSYSYNGNTPISLSVPGNYYVDFSVRKGKTIYEYKNPIPLLNVIDPREDWLVNATTDIFGKTYNQPFEKINSDGLANVGIGVGIIVSGIPFLVSFFEDVFRVKTNRRMILDDFKSLNKLVVDLSKNLKNAINCLDTDKKLVKDLLVGKISYSDLISDYYRALYLPLWESVASQLREFDVNDQIVLRTLRMFIEGSSKIMIDEYSRLSSQINQVKLSSVDDSIKEDQMTVLLKQTFQTSLKDYEKIHAKINNELSKLKWADLSKWDKIS